MNQTIQEQIEHARTLWTSALPTCPAPQDATFRLWLVENDFKNLEGALAYAPRRVERLHKNGRYTPTAVYKYVSQFLHEVKRQKAQKASTLLGAVSTFSPAEANTKRFS
jgi:hypothetical protein